MVHNSGYTYFLKICASTHFRCVHLNEYLLYLPQRYHQVEQTNLLTDQVLPVLTNTSIFCELTIYKQERLSGWLK